MLKRMKSAALILLVAALMLAGCGRDAFTAENYGENSITFHGKGAAKKSFVLTGSLTVEEGGKVIIEPEVGKGQLQINLVTFAGQDDINADAEDLAGIGSNEPVFTEVLSEGSGAREYDVAPGTYYVSAEVLKKFTGDVTVRAE